MGPFHVKQEKREMGKSDPAALQAILDLCSGSMTDKEREQLEDARDWAAGDQTEDRS